MTRRPTRRRYLATISAASAVGIAGCSSSGTDSDTEGDDDETEDETDATDDGSESGGTDGADGFLQSEAEETGQQSEQVTNRLDIVSSVGENIVDNRIQTVRITVEKAPGAGNIDLATTTLQFVHSSGSTDLTYGSYDGTGSGTEFGVVAVQDSDGSLNSDDVVLNDPADRAQFVLDTSSIVSSTTGLGEGDTATVQINTQSGGTTEVRMVVPETLSGMESVNL